MTDTSLITSTGIIAIVRGDYQTHIHAVAEALYDGGVRVLEVTLNSPGALAMIAVLSQAFQGRMLVGAGTVLTLEQINSAAESGATFCVSPDTFVPVIERALQLGVEPVPGAFTPSEIRAAVRAGARMVKLFPAMPAGAEYLKQIRAPLSDVQFVPTGGISESNIADFVRAGAVAIGIGSSLVFKEFDGSDAHLERIRQSAHRFVSLVAEARNGL